MHIKSLRLVDFRNYSNQKVEFSKNTNLLFGDNAQGKTNILEAIYICSIGKSHRGAKDIEMVAFNKECYYIELELVKRERNIKIEIGFKKEKGKAIKVSGTALKSSGELLGNLVVVIFAPDDLKMIKDGPSFRRRFLDILICQLHTSYLYDLQEYYKILNQRNNLLKQIKFAPNLYDTLDIWDENLINTGSRIIQKRIEFSKKIIEKCGDIHDKLTIDEKLEVKYESSILNNDKENISLNELIDNFYRELKKNRDLDVKRGFTNQGPHRDDLKFFINGLDIEKFGSQGQQRTAILSLKLSELKILEEEIEEKPILLLDDVFSELDESRRNYLREYIKDFQTFITSTDDIEVINENENIKSMKVKSGTIE